MNRLLCGYFVLCSVFLGSFGEDPLNTTSSPSLNDTKNVLFKNLQNVSDPNHTWNESKLTESVPSELAEKPEDLTMHTTYSMKNSTMRLTTLTTILPKFKIEKTGALEINGTGLEFERAIDIGENDVDKGNSANRIEVGQISLLISAVALVVKALL